MRAVAIVPAAAVLHFPILRTLRPVLHFLEHLAIPEHGVLHVDQRRLKVMTERAAADESSACSRHHSWRCAEQDRRPQPRNTLTAVDPNELKPTRSNRSLAPSLVMTSAQRLSLASTRPPHEKLMAETLSTVPRISSARCFSRCAGRSEHPVLSRHSTHCTHRTHPAFTICPTRLLRRTIRLRSCSTNRLNYLSPLNLLNSLQCPSSSRGRYLYPYCATRRQTPGRPVDTRAPTRRSPTARA